MRNISIGLTILGHALGLAVLLSGFVSFTCFGQTVTVRIVNAENGKPVAAQKILVSGIEGNGDPPDELLRPRSATSSSLGLQLPRYCPNGRAETQRTMDWSAR